MEGKQSNLRDFEVLSKLGEGAFGQVFKVRRRADGKEYALKKVKIGAMKEKERDNALNEIRILASYADEYIIGYKEAFYDDTSGSLSVVMEFAAGGDILKRNQTHQKNRTRYKEEEIWRALVHMARGLRSLHERKILHRDLKCANVFITADNVYKLGDLNVSKVLKKDMAQTQTGTPYYASPEVWKDKPYGLKSDIWSLGCVLYEMAALRPPFVAADLQGLYKKVCAGVFDRIPPAYSNDLAGVIAAMLKVDPEKRPNTEQLLSSPIVLKNFKGEMESATEGGEDDFDELLKTIKYNPRDLKGLRNILPKANYEEDLPQKEPLRLEDMKGGLQSCKHQRKEPDIQGGIKESMQENERKLAEFLEKKRMMEEKERQRQLKMFVEDKEEIAKKRERVLSACGLRPPTNLYESPKIVSHTKNETPNMQKQPQLPPRKEQPKLAMKLPPKPQGVGGINYKLPPRPSLPLEQERVSVEKKPSARQESSSGSSKPGPPSTPNSNRINRSNSAQKVIYPSWWG